MIYVDKNKGTAVEEILYFNTQSPDEGVYLVIEPVVATKIMASGEIKYQSPGFFMFKVFDLEGKFEKRFYNISPRYLSTHFVKLQAQQNTNIKPTWKIDIKPSKLLKSNYDVLVKIIPQNSLVGINDKVPGLENSILEIPRDPTHDIVHIENSRETLYLHGLQIKGIAGWEQHLNNYVSSFANAKYGDGL